MTASSKCVEVGHQVIEFLLTEGLPPCRHYVATADDRLLNKSIIRRKSARQELLSEKVPQAGSLAARGRIRAVAGGAVAFKHTPAARLLRVEAQLSVRFRSRLAAAGYGEQYSQPHEDLCVSSQKHIIRHPITQHANLASGERSAFDYCGKLKSERI